MNLSLLADTNLLQLLGVAAIEEDDDIDSMYDDIIHFED